MIIVKLYGDERNAGGIVNFQNELQRYCSRPENRYKHFRTGRVQSSGLLSNPVVRVFDQLISYMWFPIYLLWVRPDVIEINSSLVPGAFSRDWLYGRLARWFSPYAKLVLFNHGWNDDYFACINSRRRRKLIKYFSFFDDVIVLTGSIADKVGSLGYKGAVHVTTTGINVDLFSRVPAVSDDTEKLNLLFLSRVEKAKGIGDVLQAMPKILLRFPDAKLTVAGAGGWLDEAKEVVEKLGLHEHVEFLGYVRGDEKIRLMKESSVFVFPSYYGEGCPVSVLEAVAAGLPIVYTAVGALPDILSDGENGILIPVRCPDSIVEAITNLVSQPGLRKRVHSNNLALSGKFDLSFIHAKLESIYANNA